jgi:peptide alpha-N-acetyltransferase
MCLLFSINDIEKGYYADGEDAYDMRKTFKTKENDKEDTAPTPEEL